MAAKAKLSITFWVVAAAALAVVDVFYTPSLMNHTHGAVRWLGFALGGAVVIPLGALAARIIQKVRLFLFTQGL